MCTVENSQSADILGGELYVSGQQRLVVNTVFIQYDYNFLVNGGNEVHLSLPQVLACLAILNAVVNIAAYLATIATGEISVSNYLITLH